MNTNITISKDLAVAINNLCSGSEVKVLLSVLGFGAAKPSTIQMQKLTGISQANNYFRVRKQLVDLGYLIIDENGMHVNADKILSDYAKLTS
jgi:hypothetical protein